jgi:2-polyprenyl-3-methyl-5-hydroxy-6-metoxy-1,4-benzoquinol methylase
MYHDGQILNFMDISIPKPLLRRLIRAILTVHNKTYHWTGRLSARLEPDRLHPKHRLMDYHRFFIERVQPEDVVLDIGCGVGALALDLARHCRRVIGMDLVKGSIIKAQERARAAHVTNATFEVGDATQHPFEEKVNVVVLSNVLEHVTGRIEFLRRLKSLAPKFLIRVPRIDRDWITLYKREMGVEHRLDLTHTTEYTLQEFAAELSEAGFLIVEQELVFGEIWAVCQPLNVENRGAKG